MKYSEKNLKNQKLILEIPRFSRKFQDFPENSKIYPQNSEFIYQQEFWYFSNFFGKTSLQKEI